MPDQKIIDKLKFQKDVLIRKHCINSIGLFGEYAIEENGSGDSVDILVEFSRMPDLYEFLNIEDDLEELLDKKINLQSISTLDPIEKSKILNEVIYI